MSEYDKKMVLITLGGMLNQAEKYLADSSGDCVNHLRFSYIVGDLRNVIREIESAKVN